MLTASAPTNNPTHPIAVEAYADSDYRVVILSDSSNHWNAVDLTPEQARALAASLLEAAAQLGTN